MSYSSAPQTFEQIVRLVTAAHAGQVYDHPDGPEPYVLHLMRVTVAVHPSYRRVAFAHDCLEDCGFVPEGLARAEAVAVRLLSRPNVMTYSDYIEYIAECPGWAGECARAVKLADLDDNLGNARPGHREELRERYEQAVEVLRKAQVSMGDAHATHDPAAVPR